MMGFGGFGYGTGYGMGILGWVFQLVILVAVISVIVYLVRSFSYRNDTIRNQPDAKEIAAKRYAQGEITREEYKHIRDNL
jgi:uncharacterized membrane protein